MSDYSSELIVTVKDILEKENISYEFMQEDQSFWIQVPLPNRLVYCRLHLTIDDADSLLKLDAYLPIKISPENRLVIAEYICRANCGLRYGCFEMNFNDGEISFRLNLSYKDAMPERLSVRRLIFLPPGMIKRYCEPMLNIIFGNTSPLEAIAMAEAN